MSDTTAVRRATSLPDSGTKETEKLTSLTYGAWILGTGAYGANATQVSNAAYALFMNGSLQRIVASGGTANAVVGTVTTNTSAIYFFTVGVGGTCSNIMTATFTTLTGIVMPTILASNPTVASTQCAVAMAIVCATATAFNGGTNSFADAAYTVSLYNFIGPANIAISTESFTTVPG